MKKNTQCLLSISEATISTRLPNPRISRSTTLKLLIAISLVVAFSQITLGGIVRASESGLGCPDWPLCHGELIPPFEFHTLVEYSHRLIGTILGILVILTLWIAALDRKCDSVSFRLSLGSLFLVIAAGLLGGLTVLTELAWWLRLIHLSIAQFLIANLLILVWIAFQKKSGQAEVSITSDMGSSGKLITALILVFLLMLSGSYMIGIGASSACSTWPLCRGELFPDGFEYAIHMLHRYVAAIVTVYIGIIAIQFIRKRKNSTPIRKAAHTTLGLITLQILLGAVMIWTGFDAHLKAVHLSVATLVWMATVLLAVVTTFIFENRSTSTNQI